MNIQAYQTWTDQTAIYREAGSNSINEIMYLTLGLSGKVAKVTAELCAEGRSEAKIIRELGYCYWYATRLARIVQLDLNSIPELDISKTLFEECLVTGEICNKVKRLYSDPVNIGVKEEIRSYLSDLIAMFRRIADNFMIKESVVLSRNVAKLSQRVER